MSDYITIARPYAKAAFEYALEKNDFSSWQGFFQRAAIIVADARVKSLLVNPKITYDEKKAFIIELCGSDLSKNQRNFLEGLSHYQRLITLPEIAMLFDKYCKEHDKSIEVEVISAFEIDDALLKKLKQALNIRLQKEVSITVKEDKSLLGGVIIRAGDFVIDGSSRGLLNRMRQELITN